MRKWQKLDSTNVFACPIFKVRCDKHQHLDSGLLADFYIIEPFNWVNVIAVTTDQQILLIRQYRYGSQQQTVEIPGGIIDPGESVEMAAARELREETGYIAAHWQFLGITEPNPAIQNNRCYTYLATEAQLAGQQELDLAEDIEVWLAPLTELPKMIATGQINNALVIAAYYYFELYQRQLIKENHADHEVKEI